VKIISQNSSFLQVKNSTNYLYGQGITKIDWMRRTYLSFEFC